MLVSLHENRQDTKMHQKTSSVRQEYIVLVYEWSLVCEDAILDIQLDVRIGDI